MHHLFNKISQKRMPKNIGIEEVVEDKTPQKSIRASQQIHKKPLRNIPSTTQSPGRRKYELVLGHEPPKAESSRYLSLNQSHPIYAKPLSPKANEPILPTKPNNRKAPEPKAVQPGNKRHQILRPEKEVKPQPNKKVKLPLLKDARMNQSMPSA